MERHQNTGHQHYDFLDGSSSNEFMSAPNTQRREPEGGGALLATAGVLLLAVIAVIALILW